MNRIYLGALPMLGLGAGCGSTGVFQNQSGLQVRTVLVECRRRADLVELARDE